MAAYLFATRVCDDRDDCFNRGQLILERIFNMAGTLSVIIEFIGGGLFIYLLLKRGGK